MDVYIPFSIMALLMTIFLSLNLYFNSRKNEDIELKTFVQTRRILLPDNMVCVSIFDVQLCVSCESLHANEVCPKCGSEVNVPLSRVVGSTRRMDFPVRDGKGRNDNVIALPLASREGSPGLR
jgi:hypothetical protein